MASPPPDNAAQTPSSAVRTPVAGLRERVVRFPARREEVKRLQTLEQYAKFTADFRDQVVRVRAQAMHLRYVFAECDTSESERTQQNIRSRAEALEQVMAGGPAAWDSDGRRPLQELRRAVDAATAAVQREWKREVDDVIAKYERLGQALLRAGMADGAAINEALGRVRRLSEPPLMESEARRAAESVASVRAAVARLGASGLVEEFLVAALDGRASAQDLRQAGVVRFLDENQLWDLLRVSIR
ncbi:MAG: hypothetical protein ACK51E_02750 [Gemmatimonadota bacterium]|jgi:hypothetical protein